MISDYNVVTNDEGRIVPKCKSRYAYLHEIVISCKSAVVREAVELVER